MHTGSRLKRKQGIRTAVLVAATLVVLGAAGTTLFVISPMAQQATGFSGPRGVTGLHWLEGTWRGTLGDNIFEARYSSPEGGQVLGMSKEFLPNRPAYIEFERFHAIEGEVVVTPYPAGRQSVNFALTSHDPETRRAVFENPEHDFPTKLVYHRIESDSLVIEVSGPDSTGAIMAFSANLKKID
ncbi:hypothetical protein GF420_09835 [candidate division GN15 bacterium]|nr:hypothetical protein [candidate division GN15 bacterium]